MWLNAIHFLSSPLAPYIFCGVILAVFLYALLDSLARLSSISGAIAQATATVDGAADAAAFYEHFETLSDRLGRIALFASPANEFAKTVILDKARLLVRITRRPQEFFNSNSLIAPRLNLRLYGAMPGYLISLGLFFTFIGLVAAIAIAAQGLAKGANIDQTQAALIQLLDVASLKFISSVTGIALSILLSFIQKARLNAVALRIHAFCEAIERRTQLVTTEQLLQQWLISQEQVTRGHARLAEDIATEVTLQLGRLP